MDLKGEILLGVVEEVEAAEEREQVRTLHRGLRDSSDPFSLPERNFIGVFRLSKQLARDLIENMSPHYPEPERSTGIPIFIKILAALQLLGQGSYQKCVGQNYNLGLSQSSVSRCLSAFVDILVTHFSNQSIKFPLEEAEKAVIKTQFWQKYNFPGVIGCLDCTHIAIHPPAVEHPEHPALAFYNRKGFYSLNTQIICDSNLKILAVNARYPGSVHDAAIWQLSNIRQHLQDLFNAGEQSCWLLGDSGYGLEPWVMTPIADAPPNTPEYRYTRAHCSARNTVERTIGVLKNVFRCLLKDRVLHYSPIKPANMVYSCCILHNMRLQRGMPEEIEGEEQVIEEGEPNIQPPANNDEVIFAAARRIRNNIVRNHFT